MYFFSRTNNSIMVLFDSEKKILVEYCNMKKCIKLFDTDDLKDTIELAFANSPIKIPSTYVLQYFDNDVEDFIDLDDSEVLETCRKIKIMAIYDKQVDHDIGDDISDVSESLGYPVSTTDSSSSSIDLDTSANSLNSHSYVPWPHPFLLKDTMIRPSTLRLLEGTAKLSVADVSSIFISIFDEAIKYTL